MSRYLRITTTLGMLALLVTATNGRAQAPLVTLKAVLEAADFDAISILSREGVISTCNIALSGSITPEEEAEIRLRRGWAYLANRRLAEAKLDFDWVVERFPENRLARRDRALFFILLDKDFASAVREWEGLIERDPTFVDAYQSLAQAYVNTNQLDRAISIATKGLEYESNNGRLLYWRSIVYLKGLQPDSCLRDVDRALSMDCLAAGLPIPALYGLRGRALMVMKQFEAAEKSLRLAVQLDPTSLEHKAALCRVFSALKKHGLAHALAEDLDRMPAARSDSVAIRTCAVAFFMAHEYEKASQYAELWTGKDPASLHAFECAGLSALGRNDYAIARRRLERALEINRDSENGLAGMALVFAYDADISRRDLPRAMDCANQLCEVAKEPARGLAILGFVHLARGDTSAATAAFRKCVDATIELSPDQRATAERYFKSLEQSQVIPDANKLSADAHTFAL